MRSNLLAAVLLLIGTPSLAAEMIRPDPTLSPTEVIEVQLSALQTNDTPEVDAGIEQTWVFAHPDNKRMTGPLPRFAQMIKGPMYRTLLGHQAHQVAEIARTDDQAVYAVTVTSNSGETVIYQWRLAKLAEGEDAGAWMTTAVSPPARAGEAI